MANTPSRLSELKKDAGFTLIEMLVVMAIFLTVILVVSDLFLTITVAQEKTLSGQKAMNDLQFNLDDLAQKIRTSNLDYADYGGKVNSPEVKLNMIDSEGIKFSVYQTANNCPKPSTNCLAMSKDGVEHILSGNSLNIKRLNFFIFPLEDPFDYNEALKKYNSNYSPIITVNIGGESIETKENNKRQIDLQTTISLRNYER